MRVPVLLRLLAYPLGAYGILCLLAFFAQRSRMYFPARTDEAAAQAQAKTLGWTPWRNGSGALMGWKSAHQGVPEGRLLVCHGNAGMALDRGYLAHAFQGPSVARRLDVYILEYPGYGSRPGNPTEGHLVGAALEALDRLEAEGPEPVYLLGESIGTGVACLAAAHRPRLVKGLVLITPLNHASAVVRAHYPWLPGFLLLDRYRADAALEGYRGPTAFLLAERDEIVPARLGRALFEGYAGPKRLWIEAGAGHNTVDYDPRRHLWKELAEFLVQERP